MKSPVPTDEKQVDDRDREAAAVVLPEHEQRLADAHARNAHPNVIRSLQAEYDQARYDEIDAADDDGDDDDGLDGLTKADLEDLAAEHDVDLDGARNNGERVQRLRDASVRADDDED